jgi:uncharacterized protein YjbI with pentapeptide repeats
VSGPAEAGRDRLEIDTMYLCGSRFTRVSLKDSVIADSVLGGVRLDDVNMREAVFENVDLSDSTFHDIDLSDSTIDNASLRRLAVTGADLTEAHLKDVNLRGARIEESNLEAMTIDGILVSDLLAKWRQA